MAGTLAVNREGPTPLYLQIRSLVQAEIEANGLRPHARVPSERELAIRLGVSRMTVRAAIESMIQDGLLYRVAGKGTFVTGPKLRQRLHALTSFTEDMWSRGLRPGAEVLRNTVIKAPPAVAQRLRLQPSQPVLQLVRLRLADSQPMCVEAAHLPASRAGFLLDLDMSNRSLYATLRDHGIQVVWAEQSVGARCADVSEARVLQIPTGAAVLVTERTTYCRDGSPIEYVVSTYRADRYTFDVVLPARPSGAEPGLPEGRSEGG